MRIPFSRVRMAGNELKYIEEVLESGWLTSSVRVNALEEEFRERIGVKYACALNSCTAALHLSLEALGIGRGDKVMVPALTFTASAEVIRYLDADPVFLDVDYGTKVVTPGILEQALDKHPGVKAFILVHYGGQAGRMEMENHKGIARICRERGVFLVEDAAHAFPSFHEGRAVGSFGDTSCFSFYANKTITTGEGGMLLTDNEEIYERVKVMRLHGINRDIWLRFTKNPASWEYDVIAPGFKYNMPDINAAIGLAQLEKAGEFRSERQRCAEYYFRALGDISCLDLPVLEGPAESHSWHLFPVVLNDQSRVSRDDLVSELGKRGIGTSVHYKPLYRMSYYHQYYPVDPADFPSTEKIWKGIVSLPVYPSLKNEELEEICDTLKEILVFRDV